MTGCSSSPLRLKQEEMWFVVGGAIRIKHKDDFSDSEDFNPFDMWLSGTMGCLPREAEEL